MSEASNLDIERAIYHLFTGADRKFSKVDLGQFSSEIKPGLNVALTSGTAVLQSMDTYRIDVSIVLMITVKNLRSEYERRRLIHPLCEYAIRSLVNAQLVLVGEDLAPVLVDGATQPLEIDDLSFDGWRETTSQENFKNGETAFEARFKTSSRMSSEPMTENELHDLDEIYATFTMSEQNTTTVSGDGQVNLKETP